MRKQYHYKEDVAALSGKRQGIQPVCDSVIGKPSTKPQRLDSPGLGNNQIQAFVFSCPLRSLHSAWMLRGHWVAGRVQAVVVHAGLGIVFRLYCENLSSLLLVSAVMFRTSVFHVFCCSVSRLLGRYDAYMFR